MVFQKGNQYSKGRNLGNNYAKGNQAGKKNKKEIAWEVNENGCWICVSHAFNDKGYPRHRVNGKITSISHTMYQKYKGEISDGMHVCHHCDNPNCINPDHLFLGTNADNMADRNKKGRQSRGIKHGISCRGENMGTHKLTEREVREIKYGCKDMLHREIAQKYGVARNTVTYIKNNLLWKHV